ncbi:MAG TPA: hypothetical protein VFR01_06625 [Geobacterales bacterium]|nr:hypothetical protein [Geobacterales bacterium]
MVADNDLVLVHIDNKPAFYARIESVTTDVKRGWWQVKLLVLTVPLQLFTWIIDDSQLAGAPFTMGGTPVRLEPVVSPLTTEQTSDDPEPDRTPPSAGQGKVVSLVDRKKR